MYKKPTKQAISKVRSSNYVFMFTYIEHTLLSENDTLLL